MRTLLHARKLIAALCLAVLLFTALTQASDTSSLLYAILIPLWVLLAAIVIVSLCRAAEQCAAQRIAFCPIVPSRAPPAA